MLGTTTATTTTTPSPSPSKSPAHPRGSGSSKRRSSSRGSNKSSSRKSSLSKLQQDLEQLTIDIQNMLNEEECVLLELGRTNDALAALRNSSSGSCCMPNVVVVPSQKKQSKKHHHHNKGKSSSSSFRHRSLSKGKKIAPSKRDRIRGDVLQKERTARKILTRFLTTKEEAVDGDGDDEDSNEAGDEASMCSI